MENVKTQTQSRPRVGLVGFGYWGPNLLRNLIDNGNFDVVGVVELSPQARAKCSRQQPSIKTFDDLKSFLAETRPDAVVIATPAATHAALARQCMEAGADVLIEKPMASSVAEADSILETAARTGRKVMIDHTFLYHPAVRCLKEWISDGRMGELLYFDSVRANLGKLQPDVSVIWDLAPHDLSILDWLLDGKMPETITAMGVRHFKESAEDQCYLHMAYDNKFIAHVHLSWLAPVKLRTITLGGTKKMSVYDENLPTEKVKVYDKGVSLTGDVTRMNLRVEYRSGDMLAPAISSQEALAGMISQFHRYLTTGEKPASDGHLGRRVVQLIEASHLSLDRGGQPVRLTGEEKERYVERRKKAA